MLEIARGESAILQKDIAENQGISNKYLDQIVHSLKTAGLISNARGKKSGYVLTRDPGKITLYDIHRAFDPEVCLVECLSENIKCELSDTCQAQPVWSGLNKIVIDYMRSVTLESVLKGKESLRNK